MRKPWWRKQTQHWYVRHNREQVRLSEEPDPDGGSRKHPPRAVEDAWHRLQAGEDPQKRYKELTVKDVFEPFCRLHAHEPRQHTSWILGRFQKFVGPGKKVSSLIPNDLTRFFDANKQWNGCTRKTIVNR